MTERGDTHSVGVEEGVQAEMGGNYHGCADSSSLPTLRQPLITLAFRLSWRQQTFIPVSVIAPERSNTTPLWRQNTLKHSPAECNTIAAPMSHLLTIYEGWKHAIIRPWFVYNRAPQLWEVFDSKCTPYRTKGHCSVLVSTYSRPLKGFYSLLVRRGEL